MIINKPYTTEQYASLAIFCNNNDCHIEDKGEFLEAVKNEYTEEQIKQLRIQELKCLLAEADYWGQKYIDGEYSPEEWEEKKAQRKSWREEIRRLEDEIKEVDNGSNNGSV